MAAYIILCLVGTPLARLDLATSTSFDLPKTEEELEWEASPQMGRETL
jgi:hypothetical protein